MGRKLRSDSTESIIKAAVNALAPDLEPPECVDLDDECRPFFSLVLRARARDEWNDATLVVAANLARTMYDIEEQTKLLKTEGYIVPDERGRDDINPRHIIIEQLSKRKMAYMRTLVIGGAALGDAKDFKNKRKLEMDARKIKDELTDDDLLAT
jgi:hypothetical protein